MSFLEQFYKKINLTQETIDLLNGEELPEGKTVEDIAAGFLSGHEAVFKSKNKGVSQEEVDQQFAVYKKSLSAKINKIFALGFSRNEAEEVDVDEMLGNAKKGVDTKVKEASSTTDAKLKKAFEKLEVEHNNIKDELEREREGVQAKIDEIQQKATSEINSTYGEVAFERAWNKKLATFPEHLKKQQDIYRKQFKGEIFERFHTDKDGKITDLEGGNAINFDENGTWTKIDEPLDYLFEKYDIKPLSNGGRGGSGSGDAGAGGDKSHQARLNASEAAKKMQERMANSQ